MLEEHAEHAAGHVRDMTILRIIAVRSSYSFTNTDWPEQCQVHEHTSAESHLKKMQKNRDEAVAKIAAIKERQAELEKQAAEQQTALLAAKHAVDLATQAVPKP